MRRRIFIATVLLVIGAVAHAEGELFKVPSRPDVKTTLFWESVEGAKATVFLFPGGGGGFGKFEDGKATGGNFLVRSAPYFLANGFNVAIFGRPNDMELGWAERTEPTHMTDVAKVLEFVKQKSDLPVWIIGTSRGTVSAAAMAINVHDPAIAGLVLTSSVVRFATPGAVPRQDLTAIKMPVLVYHHAKDGCKHCQASEAPFIIKGLTNAPIKKLMVVDGGANPTGDVCAGQHWHGFIGMERNAIDQIAAWIKAPSNWSLTPQETFLSFVYPQTRRQALAQVAALLAGACASTAGSQPVKPQFVPLADMHTHLGRKTRANLPLDLAEEMRANNVLLAAWAYSTDRAYIESRPDGTHQKAEPDPTKIWAAMRNELRTSAQYAKSAGLGVVLTAKDVDRAVNGLPSVVIAAEGTDFMQGRMGLLDEVYDGGLRHLQLVHYTLNAVGDIQTEAPRHGGLSDFGREVVRKAQAKGMLVDLAHSTETAVGQALAVATKPMVWSHGWVDQVPGAYDDKVGWLRRRLSLATARKIAAAGGVVGIWGLGLKKTTLQWPVGRDDPEGYAKVIRSLVDQLGADHVAIGTDLSGMGESASVNSYAGVRRVVQALQRSGLDEASVAKVSYQNYARVLRASLA